MDDIKALINNEHVKNIHNFAAAVSKGDIITLINICNEYYSLIERAINNK